MVQNLVPQMWLCGMSPFSSRLASVLYYKVKHSSLNFQICPKSPQIIFLGWHLSLEAPTTVGDLSYRGCKQILQTDLEPFGCGILIHGNQYQNLEALYGIWVPTSWKAQWCLAPEPQPMGSWSWKEIRVWTLLVHDEAGRISVFLSPRLELCITQGKHFKATHSTCLCLIQWISSWFHSFMEQIAYKFFPGAFSKVVWDLPSNHLSYHFCSLFSLL